MKVCVSQAVVNIHVTNAWAGNVTATSSDTSESAGGTEAENDFVRPLMVTALIRGRVLAVVSWAAR